ncbi:MAG: long-chain fatty acid--CoA ligase [Rhodothermales bacterium]
MPALVPFETIPQLLSGLVAHFEGSDRPALRYKDKAAGWTPITHVALHADALAFAGWLHHVGVRPGDRVAVLSENRPEWAAADLGTQLLGAVNVALYTTLPADQVEYILRDSGARVFVVSTNLQFKKAAAVFDACPELEHVVALDEPKGTPTLPFTRWAEALAAGHAYRNTHRAELDALTAAVAPDDLSALIYTSGTTGVPKGVMLTHANICSNARAALEVFDLRPTDEHLSFLPLSHAFERTAGYVAALAGGCTITYAESIDAVAKNLPEVRPTILISVPRVFEKLYNAVAKSVAEAGGAKQKVFDWAVATGKKVAAREAAGKRAGPLLKAQYALAQRLVFSALHEKLGGRIRFAVSGGAALPRAIGEFFQAAGLPIIEGYGLTETAPVLAANPMDAPRYGSVGHVLPGVTVAIRSLDDDRLIGQLSGEDYPSTMTTEPGEIVARGPNVMRGYWNDEAATHAVIDADGWYHTGDIGRFDGGYLTITDRLKHMIVSKGGKNIYPGPIEDAFKADPAIEQLVVVGEGREFLTALVVPNEAALAALTGGATDDVLQREEVRAPFAAAFRAYSRGAASHEKIRDFRLVAEPFSEENGLMTPTMKLKRRAIEQRYAALIESMYAGTD